MVISVDTFYASVAREAVEAGADIVNDVSGGTLDPGMFEQVRLERKMAEEHQWRHACCPRCASDS